MSLQKIRELQIENERLKTEIAYLVTERDEWKDKAVEICHINTYTMEVMNKKGLQVVK